MEARKIAFACFVGGALCCAIALLFAPVYWWFGLIAGLAGGYISYEFREVYRAIPIALRVAGRGSVYAWDNVIASAKTWLSQPHPFFYPSALLALPFVAACFGPPLVDVATVPVLIGLLVEIYAWSVTMLVGLIALFALIGARVVEHCYWVPTIQSSACGQEEWFKEMQKKGYREVPVKYANVARWTAEGVAVTLKFFAWTLWKDFAIGAWATLCFFGRFLWHLFRLIHSEKRVLCAMDGTIGGAVSYIWLTSASMSFAEQTMLVIFGGLLGAAVGVVNWEVVSKRILHVHVPVNSG